MSDKKMQLRSRNHLHFIQAVRDGEVTKLVNVSRGRPALVFKKVSEIYGFQDAERIDPPSRVCSTKKVDASEFDPNRVKLEFPTTPVRKDQCPSDFDSPGDVNERGRDLDDFTFGNMTLSQLKERCRIKKRKWSASAAVNGKKGAGANNEESCSNYQLGRDDSDLEEPLIKWKSKLKKNIKRGKKKPKKSQVEASSQNAIMLVKTEAAWFEDSLVQHDWDLPMPVALKVEAPEYYHTGYEMTVFVPNDSSISEDEEEASYLLCAREELQQADGCVSHTELPSSESPSEGIEYDQLKFSSDEADSTADTLELRNCSKDLQSEQREEECVVNDDFHIDINGRSTLPDGEPILIQNSIPQHNEFTDAKLPSNFETRSIESPTDDPPLHCDAKPSLSLTSNICSVSSANDFSEREDKLPPESVHTDEAKTCFQHIPPSDTVQEYPTLESVEDNGSPGLQHVSRRLPCTRKVISPTAQEWLCKAMRSNELPSEHHKCRGKLYFKKQRDEKIPLVETTDRARAGDLNGQLKKQKNEGTGSPPKGIQNQNMRQLSSPSTSRMNLECNSMRSSSENAIAFSQRQMQDIENLATKLMDELKSVKEIVGEASHSGGAATQSKYDLDEVKVRIEKATRAEETARRWLSMMSRDCNRFCKIMKMTEKRRPTPGTVPHKQRKISFADEAGRELCYVKYI